MGLLLLVSLAAIVGGVALGALGVAAIRGRSRLVTSGAVAGLCLGAAVILVVIGVGGTAFAIALGPHPW